MIRFVASFFLLILTNSVLHASLADEEFFRRFKSIESRIEDEIAGATQFKICPNQNVSKWIDTQLTPIESYFKGFGKTSDPMVGSLMASLTNFSRSLKCFYEADSTASKNLPKNLHLKFAQSFKQTLLQHIEFSGTALKLYMNMVLYHTPSKYAETFPDHMGQNHEIAMRSATENLRKFYLLKSFHDLNLDDDTGDAQIATLFYKTYKPFCVSWQNDVNNSWNIHQAAFKRINARAFETQKSSILKTTQTLESLKVGPSWKKDLSQDQFSVMIMSLLRNAQISKIEIGGDEILIIEPRKRTAPLTAKAQGKDDESLSSDAFDLSEALLHLTISSSEPLEESPRPKLSPLPVEPLSPILSPSNDIPLAQPLDPFFPALLDTPHLTALEDDAIQSDLLEATPGLSEQLPTIFEFVRTLERSQPTPVVHKKRAKRQGQKKNSNNRSSSTAFSSSDTTRSASSTDVTVSVAYEQGRAVLPLGRKMTPEAIVEFLKAMDNQSSVGKGRRSKSVKDALNILRGYKTMRLKKAYKIMLSIVPHVGLFESDRGKGSHCLLTIYQDGLVSKK